MQLQLGGDDEFEERMEIHDIEAPRFVPDGRRGEARVPPRSGPDRCLHRRADRSPGEVMREWRQ